MLVQFNLNTLFLFYYSCKEKQGLSGEQRNVVFHEKYYHLEVETVPNIGKTLIINIIWSPFSLFVISPISWILDKKNKFTFFLPYAFINKI